MQHGKRIDVVDIEVGRRIRTHRVAKGISQTDLGHSVGVTFQQIQKYEKGSNRVGPSRLQRIADKLGVAVAAFFPMRAKRDDRDDGFDFSLVQTQGAIKLLRDYASLPPHVRHSVIGLLNAMALEAANHKSGLSARSVMKL